MRPLVVVRRAAPFDPTVLSRHPLLWPLTRAASVLSRCDDFPPIDELDGVFVGTPPVRFVPANPRRRRSRQASHRGPVDARTLYDARITVDGEVPTRPRCWHDLMNALVWGTFPRAKRALHARQYRAISARLGPGDTSLPPTRTRELDALAILDEGGIAVLAREPVTLREALKVGENGALHRALADNAATGLIFGHAIYESLALRVNPAVVAAIVLADRSVAEDVILRADSALVDAIADDERLRSPDELARIDIRDLLRDDA